MRRRLCWCKAERRMEERCRPVLTGSRRWHWFLRNSINGKSDPLLHPAPTPKYGSQPVAEELRASRSCSSVRHQVCITFIVCLNVNLPHQVNSAGRALREQRPYSGSSSSDCPCMPLQFPMSTDAHASLTFITHRLFSEQLCC
jgi:hypothetical protein